MGKITAIPRHAPQVFLPGLKKNDLVSTKKADYTQVKGGFTTQYLPVGSIGRVASIDDMGGRERHDRFERYLVFVRFTGHSGETNFYAEELVKIKVPRPIRRLNGRKGR